MRYGITTDRNRSHIFLSLVRTLADGLGHHLGLAVTETHSPILIADHNECSKTESSTALDDFSTTIDKNYLLEKLRVLLWGNSLFAGTS